MEQELNTLREKFVQDLFVSQGLGAVIDEAHYGYAKCSMEIEPRHCNALGIPMGGTIFTLADFAFAVASNQRGRAHGGGPSGEGRQTGLLLRDQRHR